MPKRKTYDPASYDLASLFLQDVPLAREKQCDELAALIQQTIEDFIADIEQQRRDNSQFGVGA